MTNQLHRWFQVLYPIIQSLKSQSPKMNLHTHIRNLEEQLR